MKRNQITAFLLALLLLAQGVLPIGARAYDSLAAGDDAIRLITKYEGFSSEPYEHSGQWYIGYGSQIGETDYPDGISEAEAVALLRKDLSGNETALNQFFAKYGLSPTQAQFDALLDFTYTLGPSWLDGSSALLRLVRGEEELSRREAVRAFGIWSHVGGTVLPALAERRLEEAALYLDGTSDSAGAFAYLSVAREEGVACETDFAVYERGAAYDAFPMMFRLGYTITGIRSEDGSAVHLGDTVSGSVNGSAIWEKNTYEKRFDDVPEGKWYYDYVMELNRQGVISGRDENSFDPAAPVTVGEALKLILLAAGHPEQEPGEAHWAEGYAAYARENAYLSDTLLSSLDEPILRLDVAVLAARALRLAQSFSGSPFADANDGYATALYEAGILTGSVSGGETVYHPGDSLTRAELSAIVWRLRSQRILGISQTVSYVSRVFNVASNAPLNRYNVSGFSGSGKTMTYTEPGVTVLRGIDVSRWQGEIDWRAAAADGIDFAILRAGGRMQNSGELYDDTLFESYYAGAKAAGLIVGVYFYSQAVNTDEALEEADYVLRALRDKKIDGPVVFDWETAGSDNRNARSNNVPVQTVCSCAVAFCQRIREAGYTPMIYMNTYDGYVKYDVTRLRDYDIWYAGQYNGAYPRFVYDFAMWQYTSSGKLSGVSGGVDMDLWFLR